jgi:hypothetical protein
MFRYRRLSNTPNGGDMQFGHGAADFLVDSSAAVAQAIYTRLMLWQGEYWLNLLAGTPWYQQILGKPRGPGAPDAAIRARIAGTPFVVRIINYGSAFNPTNRSWTVGAQVDTTFGRIDLNFVLPVPNVPSAVAPPPSQAAIAPTRRLPRGR